jgi:methylenetetrahydrofolate dehydrogenase (NADP+)/methenyltetrahydrofolate cyclohydrolase
MTHQESAPEETHITKILNGTGLAREVRNDLRTKILASKIKPGLAVILVGQDPASQIYIDFKKKASEEVGIQLESFECEEDFPEKKLLKLIRKLNEKKSIHGILVQLPLPDQIDEQKIIAAILPEKDVDGFHPVNVGWLSIGHPLIVSATAKAIWRMIQSTNVEVKSKEVVIVGASNIVGKPIAQILLNKRATVTVCHSRTKDLALHTLRADVLVSAVGKPNLITADMVKPGAIVVDAGISRTEEGKVVGDVDFERVKEVAGWISPVPGGVGPMTVAMLLENTWEAMRRLEGLDAKSEMPLE